MASKKYFQQLVQKIIETFPTVEKKSKTYIQYSEAHHLNELVDETYELNSIPVDLITKEFINLLTCDSDGLDNWGNILQVNRKAIVRVYLNQFGVVKSNPYKIDDQTKSTQNLNNGNLNYTLEEVSLPNEPYRVLLLMKNYSRYCMGTVGNVARVLNLFLGQPSDENGFAGKRQFFVTDIEDHPLLFNVYYTKPMDEDTEIHEAFRTIFKDSDLLPRFTGCSFEFIYDPEGKKSQCEEWLLNNNDSGEELAVNDYLIATEFAKNGVEAQPDFDSDANNFSWNKGWGDFYTKPLGKDIQAKAITQDQLNGLINQVTKNILLLLKSGKNPASDLFASRGNPYMVNDMVWEGLDWLISLQNNNVATRAPDNIHWSYLSLILKMLTISKNTVLQDGSLTYKDGNGNVVGYYNATSAKVSTLDNDHMTNNNIYNNNIIQSPSFQDIRMSSGIGKINAQGDVFNMQGILYLAKGAVIQFGSFLLYNPQDSHTITYQEYVNQNMASPVVSPLGTGENNVYYPGQISLTSVGNGGFTVKNVGNKETQVTWVLISKMQNYTGDIIDKIRNYKLHPAYKSISEEWKTELDDYYLQLEKTKDSSKAIAPKWLESEFTGKEL